ncbi:RagB/SusD family nutrient uptake outer membrane protein [uncultured Muribaculum sp.]|uniref:RagB/SusD family nutrient uptake outer membrane protein n=1 Tax=uncultured Muribaculum sp. TaxID=1918613 RepID=UPI0025DC568F|nr:RagB/SusD family nutrient uptake outer membrane protein [uncultured Muribaculum sp.]
MNNIFKFSSIIALAVSATGCSDFLEEELRSTLSPENTYTSSIGFEAGSAGLYSLARSEYNTWGEKGAFMHNGACAYATQQIATDIVFQSGAKDGSLTHYANLTMTPSTLFIESYWNWSYSLINSSNELLIYSEKNTNWSHPGDKALYQAEARFFRAYAYRSLQYLYGDVPWVETIQQPFVLNFTRTPKAEVLANMVKDLEFAAANLPENPDGVKPGKLTKWAALHLLAEVYICQGEYEKARKAAQDVIDSGYFSLMKERFGAEKSKAGDYFHDLFVENNQNRPSGNRESIWVMQFEYKTTGGGTPSDDWTRREWLPQYHQLGSFFKICSEYGGRGLAQIAPFKWWIGTKNTNATANQSGPDGIFEDTDIRNSEYNFKREWIANQESTKGQRVQITDKYWQDGWLFPAPTKFFFAHDDDLTHTGSYRDRMKFRLAETYLLLAEAYLGLNDAENAAKAVNVVRSRAKASSIDKSKMDMDFLLDERIRELVGEESRRFTLVRTGKYVDRVKKYNDVLRDKVEPYHALWPIPKTIRDANRDVEFPQNLGYEGAK